MGIPTIFFHYPLLSFFLFKLQVPMNISPLNFLLLYIIVDNIASLWDFSRSVARFCSLCCRNIIVLQHYVSKLYYYNLAVSFWVTLHFQTHLVFCLYELCFLISFLEILCIYCTLKQRLDQWVTLFADNNLSLSSTPPEDDARSSRLICPKAKYCPF